MKVTILTYLEREGSDTYDIVVDQVAEALKAGGHKASVLGVHGDLGKLIAGVRRRKPDLPRVVRDVGHRDEGGLQALAVGRHLQGVVGVAPPLAEPLGEDGRLAEQPLEPRAQRAGSGRHHPPARHRGRGAWPRRHPAYHVGESAPSAARLGEIRVTGHLNPGQVMAYPLLP